MEDKELYEKLLGVKEPWDVIDVTVDMQKGCVAVKLGLKRRVSLPVRALAIDETSFQKRHEYVTVLFDRLRHDTCGYARKKAGLNRRQKTLQRFLV